MDLVVFLHWELPRGLEYGSAAGPLDRQQGVLEQGGVLGVGALADLLEEEAVDGELQAVEEELAEDDLDVLYVALDDLDVLGVALGLDDVLVELDLRDQQVDDLQRLLGEDAVGLVDQVAFLLNLQQPVLIDELQ